jgi:NifU-like protein involved in Fe-S cluster formation
MSEAARLYTPELLALTVQLAAFPLSNASQFVGQARSRSCGSTLQLALDLDHESRISSIGMRVSACAVGQAAAAIFAANAEEKTGEQVTASLNQIDTWLAGEGPPPHWPGIDQLEAARAFPGRHGAIRLAWQAASEALSSAAVQS